MRGWRWTLCAATWRAVARRGVACLAVSCLAVSCTAPRETAEPLVRPDLSRLDGAVRAQIEAALKAVDDLAEDAPLASRGEAWGALGRLWDTYGFTTAAAVSYRNARRFAPNGFQWHYYWARIARAEGDLDAAEGALEAALALLPDDTAALAELGELRVDQRRLAEAQDIAEGLIASDPSSASGLLLRARVATEAGEWQQALADYERLLVLQPAADRLHRPAAIAARELGDETRARRHLAQQGPGDVVIDNPWLQALVELKTGVNSLLDEGLTRYQRGDFAGAEALFARAIAADPENARAHLDRGSALEELGRLDEALEAFDEALRLQPDYPKALYNRGVVLATRGDDVAALEAYDRALELDPDYDEARFNRANALRRMGRLEVALAAYEELVRRDPAQGAAHLGRAICLVRLGRDVEALSSLEASDRLFPRSPTFKNLMARLLVTSSRERVRDTARGLSLAQRLVAAAPTVEHVETLAMAQAAVGDFDGAVHNLETTLAALARQGQTAAGAPLVRRLKDFRAGRSPKDPGVD